MTDVYGGSLYNFNLYWLLLEIRRGPYLQATEYDFYYILNRCSKQYRKANTDMDGFWTQDPVLVQR